jgi:lysophospholipase L1-like esterase
MSAQFLWLIALVLSGLAFGAAGAEKETPAWPSRVVFLGDSITDGFSYPSLVRQALREAGKPVPVCVNAGIGGDTAKGMRARLDRDVFVHRPDLVTLSAGINDVLHKVALEGYEADARAILERMKQEKVPVLILTTSVLGGKTEEADRRLAGHNAILRKLAEEYGQRIADVYQAMDAERKKGTKVLEEDDVHPNYAGHRCMARAVLDALGCADVPVPEKMKVEPYPGLLTPWRVKAVADPKAAVLDEKSVAAMAPDASWTTISLPEAGPQAHWWFEQIRQEGFALSLEKVAGKAPRYIACAALTAEKARKAYVNTGGGLQTVWLNGRRIYKAGDWTGYHPGRERIPVEIQAGENSVVIETGPQFFLSVTGDSRW